MTAVEEDDRSIRSLAANSIFYEISHLDVERLCHFLELRKPRVIGWLEHPVGVFVLDPHADTKLPEREVSLLEPVFDPQLSHKLKATR